jgi:hypothetical protein
MPVAVMSTKEFTHTSGSISRLASCTGSYVLELARGGHIAHTVASNGTFLFPREVADQVRAIKAARLARRGRYARRTCKPAPSDSHDGQ